MNRREFSAAALAWMASPPAVHAKTPATVGVIATDVRSSTRFRPLTEALRAHVHVVFASGLVSYGPHEDIPRQLAHFVARILRGASAGDLPIEQPARFELVINARAATALGIGVPVAVLSRADEVIR